MSIPGALGPSADRHCSPRGAPCPGRQRPSVGPDAAPGRHTSGYERVRTMRENLTWRFGVVGLACWLGACSGPGELATHARKPASERPDVDTATAAKGALAVPATEAFNLTSFRSGQTGTGRGESKALGAGGAVCQAATTRDGTAWGEFQLGYCFDNTTGGPLDAIVKVHLAASESATGGREDGAPNASSANTLTFFIKDTNGLVIKRESLLSSGLDKGAAAVGAKHDLVFDVRFAPNCGYYLVLSGRAEVQSDGPHPLEASLSVDEYALRIEWQGVVSTGLGPVGTAGDLSASTSGPDTLLP